jgi:hypothetical protein
MIKYLLALLSLFVLWYSSSAQEQVYVGSDLHPAQHSRIQIATSIPFPDIKVQIGQNIPFEDVVVGITTDLRKADYVLAADSRTANRRVLVDAAARFAALKIQYGAQLPFPAVSIEVRKDNSFPQSEVQHWIYSERGEVSDVEIIACLLPLIQLRAQVAQERPQPQRHTLRQTDEKNVTITTDLAFPDVEVLIGRDLVNEDISVGITNQRNKADYKLTTRTRIVYDNGKASNDLNVLYGADISFPDVRIEVREDAFPAPDYWIYSQDLNVSDEAIIETLLPIILRELR